MQNIADLAAKAYLANARKAFGEAGAECIRGLLDSVRSIYQRCPPEGLKGTLTVVKGIHTSPLAPIISTLGVCISIQDYAEVGSTLYASAIGEHDIIEICADGTFRHHHSKASIDPVALAQDAIVYRFEGGVDRIVALTFDDIVPKISPMLKSMFATPTLASLESALERYGRDMVPESQCRILSRVWEEGVDGPRLILVNRPESIMRDSLVQALMLMTRDASVRPEQNTDETKPVDIRVEWFGSGASALIEVKWMGKSVAKSQSPTPHPTYTEYKTRRAQEGADQLADYMDRQVRHSGATTAPRGYLVVFDARRLNTKGSNDKLKKADAMYFAAEEIIFDPDHSKTRQDFAAPYRFFMKPRESWFAAA